MRAPFHRIFEGEVAHLGLNLRLISDGGFAIIWMGKNRRFYLRVRGLGNKVKHRILFSKEKA